MKTKVQKGIRAAQYGIVINIVLAGIKLAAGIIGNTYALVADAVESIADIFGSLIVWGGLHIASQPADEDHPYGHGKAEALAAAAVSLMLLAAAFGIGLEAAREIRTPHHAPEPWTLVVLVGVMLTKAVLSKRVGSIGKETESTAVQADAAHHLSDAITSAAAFIGISVAILGSHFFGGTGWESADDWAALVASAVIAFNGISMMRACIQDLMDQTPSKEMVLKLENAAHSVEGVLATEKIAIRKTGMHYHVSLDVQVEPSMTIHDAHIVGGKVKTAIREAIPDAWSVLVHLEPYHG